ncbi:hypothetical protein [Nonomuraea insulae]|uniref:Uncharacterized protein n=1 Tax=Nonomuraea insulae TaxID=1616787 RepID=A0ABW1D6H2_9ACTN
MRYGAVDPRFQWKGWKYRHARTCWAPAAGTARPGTARRSTTSSPSSGHRGRPAKESSPRPPGWNPGPIAAPLPLLAHARAFLATAVAADRAAGATWAEIVAVLDVSADTVVCRYHT